MVSEAEATDLWEETVEGKVLGWVSANLRLFNQRSASYLDLKMRAHKRRLAKQSLGRTLHMRSDARLAFLLSTSRFQIGAFLLAALKIALMVVTVLQIRHQVRYSTFRLSELDPWGYPSAFGILIETNGCLEPVQPLSVEQRETALFAHYDRLVDVHGVYLSPSSPNASHPPPSFVVHGRSDDGDWLQVGGSGWRLADVGLAGQRRGERAEVGRGGQMVADFRVHRDIVWYLGFLWGETAVAGGVLLAGLAGLVQREWRGKQLLASGMGLACLGFLAAASARHGQGRGEEAAGWWVKAALACGSGLLLWQWDNFLTMLLLYEGGVLLTDAVSGCVLFGVCSPAPLRLATAGLLCTVWLALAVYQRSVAGLVAAVVEGDRKVRERLWESQLAAEPQLVGSLRALQAQVQQMAVARQCVHLQSQAVEDAGLRDWRSEQRLSGVGWMAGGREQRETSLDQIYSQAVCADPLLRSKVQEWALASGGMVCTKDGEFVEWAAVAGGEGEASVQWAELKKEERAMEKVLRCYGDDVSKLVDVCRQSLVFATVGGIARCLAAMAGDGEVVVVRVKNRMRLQYSSTASAGFRNVSVNLRLTGPAARLFGVEGHVCEVQLLLHALTQLELEPGAHRRYLAFRELDRPSLYEWLRQCTEKLFTHSLDQHHATDHHMHRKAAGPTAVRRGSDLEDAGAMVAPADFVREHRETITALLQRRNKGQGTGASRSKGLRGVSAASVLFMRLPVVGALSKPTWRVLVGLMTLVAWGLLCLKWAGTLAVYFPPAQHALFRFDSLESRGGAAGTGRVAGFGPALDGCPVALDAVRDGPVGEGQWERAFGAPVRMNGFWFDTAEGDEQNDPVRFQVQGSEHGGDSWEQVGSSTWMSGSSITWRDGVYPTPLQRSQRVVVDLRPPMLGLRGQLTFPVTVGLTAGVYMASQGDFWVSNLLGFSVFLSSCLHLLYGLLLLADGFSWLGLAEALLFFPMTLQALGVSLWQRHMMSLVSLTALMVLGMFAVRNALILGDAGRILVAPEYYSLWLLGCALVALSLRYYILRRARNIIQQDHQRYDELWGRVLDDPSGQVLVDLAELSTLTQAVVPGPARQLELRRGTSRRGRVPRSRGSSSPSSQLGFARPGLFGGGRISLGGTNRSLSTAEEETAGRRRARSEDVSVGAVVDVRLEVSSSLHEGFDSERPRRRSVSQESMVSRDPSAVQGVSALGLREPIGVVESSPPTSECGSSEYSVEGLLGSSHQPAPQSSLLHVLRSAMPCCCGQDHERRSRMDGTVGRRPSHSPVGTLARWGYRHTHHGQEHLDNLRAVRSLEQIYSQALCLNPLLRSKVQEWALASGGMVCTKDGEFVEWAAVAGGEGEASVQWAELKKEERAMEKVLRCYGDDVSKLVDVCRQSLVFATVGGIARCLAAMAGDGEVVVVRVKNRMSVQYSSTASAGFRNVSVNLRLTGPAARLFGVEGHVCEVQLLLHQFAQLMKEAGHKRYVAFRNIRGE